jgi:hypothetical protein
MTAAFHDLGVDFAIYDASGRLILIAQAKNTSVSDAPALREWFPGAVRPDGGSVSFVILATRDTIFVWHPGVNAEEAAAVDARRVLAPYHRESLDLATMSHETFEFVVGAWLQELCVGFWSPTTADEIRAFVDSGLLAAVENGRVASHLAA